MKTRGFSLIEILAALVLVAIVVPVVMQGFAISTSVANMARQRVEAAELAESKLNELAVTGDWQLGVLSGDFSPNTPGYQWSASVESWDATTLLQLSVRVYWTVRGEEHDFTVTTLVDQAQ